LLCTGLWIFMQLRQRGAARRLSWWQLRGRVAAPRLVWVLFPLLHTYALLRAAFLAWRLVMASRSEIIGTFQRGRTPWRWGTLEEWWPLWRRWALTWQLPQKTITCRHADCTVSGWYARFQNRLANHRAGITAL